MTWAQEIIRAALLALGLTQIVTNIGYLSGSDGIRRARKQHQELPASVSDGGMRVKVICMLISGIALFGVGLYSYLVRGFAYTASVIVLGLFAIYAGTEAASYRYWKTAGFAFVSAMMLFVTAYFGR